MRVRGWIGEECESAALESLVRRPCLTSAHAYMRGRAAALDELRRLTGWRRKGRPLITVLPLDVHEQGIADDGFDAVNTDDMVRRLPRLTAREREAVLHTVHGLTGQQTAARMNVHPSRVTQLLASSRSKMAVGLWSCPQLGW